MIEAIAALAAALGQLMVLTFKLFVTAIELLFGALEMALSLWKKRSGHEAEKK